MDEVSAGSDSQPDNMEIKKRYRAPVFLATKDKHQRNKRQMEDAPAIYEDNLPPAPSTGLWSDYSPAPTSTTLPKGQALLKAITNFNNAEKMLAMAPAVMKRQKRQVFQEVDADNPFMAADV